MRRDLDREAVGRPEDVIVEARSTRRGGRGARVESGRDGLVCVTTPMGLSWTLHRWEVVLLGHALSEFDELVDRDVEPVLVEVTR